MKQDADLIRSIEHHQPDSILAVGKLPALPVDLNRIAIHHAQTLQDIREQPRHRLAYVRHCLEDLPLEEGRQLLAALRDIHAEIVYVLAVLDNEKWSHNTFAELGFRQLEAYEHEQRESGLFYFDIYQYKLTPDWLNARFWANPERWGVWEE